MKHAANFPNTRDLADHLVVIESASGDIADFDILATCRICEKLRRPLVAVTGTAGYASLLSRSLTLAKRQAPALASVQVKPDGTLDGLVADAAEEHPILVGCLLGLLMTFIGEALTMRVLNDIWPGKLDADWSLLPKDSAAKH